jgi:dipeptidyl aminopeptidase/acylaminoacyl peptidase
MTDASNRPMPLSMTDLISMAESRAVAVSADGALLAWLSNASGQHQIWLRDLPDGEARQLTDMPDRIGAMAFSPVARDLVFTMDRNGDERHQLWLIPDAAGAPEPLTQDPDTVHAWGCWAPDGQDIAYSSNARDRRVMDVMVMTPATRAARCVLEGKGWCAPVCFTPDGQGLVIRESRRGPMDQDLWLLDIATGARRLLVGQGDGGAATAILAARFAPDGRLFVLCDRGDGFHGIHALDPDRGEMIAVAQVPGQDVELFSQPPSQARLAFVANDAGYSRLHLRERYDEPGREVALPAPGVVSSLRFDPDGTALLLSFETACDPSSVWRYDLEAKRFEALSDEPRAGIPREALTMPELEEFTTSDGTVVPAFVYRPRHRADRLPVLFMVHGGPESQWRPGFRADLQHYVDRGILVVAPNVRGSTGYGRAYHQLDDRERRLDAVRDLCDMAEAVARWPEVDAGRIGAMGQSYGGYVVMAAMCSRPDLWKTGVNLYGVSNFITLMRTTGPWRRALRTAEYGEPETMGEFLDAISPVNQLERMRAPLLMVHAIGDPRVPMEQSEQVFAILRGFGRRVEYLRLAGEGHGFARRENAVAAFTRVARFLDETL